MNCTADDKRTLIDCELGNTIQRDAEVSCTEFPIQLLFYSPFLLPLPCRLLSM